MVDVISISNLNISHLKFEYKGIIVASMRSQVTLRCNDKEATYEDDSHESKSKRHIDKELFYTKIDHGIVQASLQINIFLELHGIGGIMYSGIKIILLLHINNENQVGKFLHVASYALEVPQP
ncbi:hypothetical protein ACJX0J_022278 [Zea mays]